MGEYAEMMLDGTLCEGCGEYIGSSQGFPGYCSAECAGGSGYFSQTEQDLDAALNSKPYQCPVCAKAFRTHQAMNDHMNALGHVTERNVQCSCGRRCAGERGLRDHRAAKGCPC